MDNPGSILQNIALACSIGTVVSLIFLSRWRKIVDRKRRHKQRNKDSAVNVGGIFGMDVGGTLAKIVYFETDLFSSQSHASRTMEDVSPNAPQKMKRIDSMGHLDDPSHQEALQQLYSSINVLDQQAGVIRDENLSFYSSVLHGRLHFLHFETRNMVSAINRLASTGIPDHIKTIGCTGGGAHKYAPMMEEELGIQFQQQDELNSLVIGMQFAMTNVEGEIYTYRCEEEDEGPASETGAAKVSPTAADSKSSFQGKSPPKKGMPTGRWTREVREHTRRVTVPFVDMSLEQSDGAAGSAGSDGNSSSGGINSSSNPPNACGEGTGSAGRFDSNKLIFPYLVVNIGSGVSILKISAPGVFERISGSSIGGGTYWGLCRLLTKCKTFEEVLDIADSGDATEVDMLVRDIYGGGYDERNLSATTVASSFGKLVMKEHPRDGIKEEDLAKALLMMITNNIGQVSYLNAKLHVCRKIFFIGNFLRHNPISCRRLAYAIDFWSQGEMEALFLTHEGYFGALGTFLMQAFGDEVGRILNISQSRSIQKEVCENVKSRKPFTVYGLDNEFLHKIRNWRPPSFSSLRTAQLDHSTSPGDAQGGMKTDLSVIAPATQLVSNAIQSRDLGTSLHHSETSPLPLGIKRGGRMASRSVDYDGESNESGFVVHSKQFRDGELLQGDSTEPGGRERSLSESDSEIPLGVMVNNNGVLQAKDNDSDPYFLPESESPRVDYRLDAPAAHTLDPGLDLSSSPLVSPRRRRFGSV